MRTLLASLALVVSLRAADAPLVEAYLHKGQYAQGEQALTLAMAKDPRNDQLRYSLGLLQFFHAVERMGQGAYDFGVKSENANAPFLRLPVPKNPKPLPMTYSLARRGLESVHADLERCEKTLAGVWDDNVTLPLRLAPVKFDFDGDGTPTDEFRGLLSTVFRRNLEFLKGNSEFYVRFDRGDVAWLRAYCHLLMGMIDGLLAFDLEDEFDRNAGSSFADPRRKKTTPIPENRDVLLMKEPARLGAMRKHLLEVCKLNKETWKHIRAETDDDHEWLPNEKQKGVLGMPVRKEQIDGWLDMMAELEGLLEGKKLIPENLLRLLWPQVSGGLNVKTLLDDPPEKFDWDAITKSGPQAKYLEKNGGEFNVQALFTVANLFSDPMGMNYMAWFN